MSENKIQLSPEEIKLQEELAKNQKSLEKSKLDLDAAKVRLADAQKASVVKNEDPKVNEAALKELEEARLDYTKKSDAVMAARIKCAQTGTYLPKETERGLFHVKLDRPAFRPSDGKKLSKAFIQKFTTSDFNAFKSNSSVLGYTVEVMWNPINFSL